VTTHINTRTWPAVGLSENPPLAELTASAAIATLRRIANSNGQVVPICSACKRVRDESRRWLTIAQSLRDRAGVGFSHGICPECLKRLYPEYA
jgi:hypothetical protein